MEIKESRAMKLKNILIVVKDIEKSKRFLFKAGLITVVRHFNRGRKVEIVENK